MLISYNGELVRLQCAFVDTPEVDKIVDFIGEQRGYPQAFLLPEYIDEKELEAKGTDLTDRDSLFEDAARLIVASQVGSTSLLQRRMKLGYNRAGRLMDQLEAAEGAAELRAPLALPGMQVEDEVAVEEGGGVDDAGDAGGELGGEQGGAGGGTGLGGDRWGPGFSQGALQDLTAAARGAGLSGAGALSMTWPLRIR